MVEFKVKCATAQEKDKKMAEIHNGLVGTPGYKNSEILLYEDPSDDKIFGVIIGENNKDDITYTLRLPRGVMFNKAYK